MNIAIMFFHMWDMSWLYMIRRLEHRASYRTPKGRSNPLKSGHNSLNWSKFKELCSREFPVLIESLEILYPFVFKRIFFRKPLRTFRDVL